MLAKGQCTVQKTSQVFNLVRSDYEFFTDVHCVDVAFFQHMFASKVDEFHFWFIHFSGVQHPSRIWHPPWLILWLWWWLIHLWVWSISECSDHLQIHWVVDLLVQLIQCWCVANKEEGTLCGPLWDTEFHCFFLWVNVIYAYSESSWFQILFISMKSFALDTKLSV